MSKKAQQRERTRVALIEKAEELFAQLGVDGVSLRQIGQAIGSSNTNVIGYYFGTKEKLIEEVFYHREPEIDRRRAELLARAEERGLENDIFTLIHALWWPAFEMVDAAGRHTYSAFWHAIVTSGRGQIRRNLAQEFTATAKLNRRLREKVVGTADHGDHCIRLAFLLTANSLAFIDAFHADDSLAVKAAIYDEALRFASSIISYAASEARGTRKLQATDG